jgi:hypothetical protein
MTTPKTPDQIADAALLALIADMRRFQRAASAADALHVPDGNGKCRECRKAWRCPTSDALLSGLHWDGREPEEAKES